MAVSALLASLLLAQASAPAATVDVAYDDLMAGKAAAAIDKIEHGDVRDAKHPAALINLGIAYARVGRTAEARALFEAAANSDERYRLETADSKWIDSRDLARQAVAMLDRGELTSTQFAAR